MSKIMSQSDKIKENGKIVMKLENLSKNYGKYLAVENINIEVYEGEIIGLVGPNGAGKTTTIKLIAKLLNPTSGRILIKNNSNGEMQDLNKNSRNLIRRGFLIDIPFFYNDMTAYQLLRYFAIAQNYPKENINKQINELLKIFKLSDWKLQKVKSFSKGMRQKLGIIQAILVDPQIIILDEPQSGLDPKARIEIREIIRILRAQGKTIFIASHMLHEISKVCDKIALLNHGKIIAFDTIENLEKQLKINILECQIIKPLNKRNQDTILSNLISILRPYLDNNEEIKRPIEYISEEKIFKIYYDGDEESKFKILEILVNDFKSIFLVTSFTQEKTTQLERIYSEMIVDYEPKINSNKKRFQIKWK